jgi:hypothetical protein
MTLTIQCKGSLGFALKAAEGLWIFGYLVGQELEGNKPAELDTNRPSLTSSAL